MISGFLPRPKKPWRSRCWLTRRGTGFREISRRQPAQNERRCWAKSRILKTVTMQRKGRRGSQKLLCVFCALSVFLFSSCASRADPKTLVMIIESSPTNLDPRVGIDAYSERIDELLFDALVRRDEHFNLKPWLADSWETPDPLNYRFHLHPGVRFQDGRPLTARDVKYTFDTIMN